jgi:hypothetical protein
MARVMICPACAHVNSVSEMFCVGCGASLANVDPTEDVPLAGAATVAAPAPTGAASAAAPTMVPPVLATHREERPARLRFEWGEVMIGPLLQVGRDAAFSPIADRLQAYDTVSGRHAELRPQGDGITVAQVGRTNPTYLDGRPLREGESATARDGTVISFSRALSATLRIG